MDLVFFKWWEILGVGRFFDGFIDSRFRCLRCGLGDL